MSVDHHDLWYKAIGEGFYLPAVAEALGQLSEYQETLKEYEVALAEKSDALTDITKPVLLTEGKTDEMILQEAWRRLSPGEECPFHIRSCDTAGPGAGGGAAGADKLSISLKSVRADHPHTVIGLFDRDGAGIKGWELDRNFKVHDLGSETKVSANGRAYAFLLPVPAYRKECAKHDNMPIEYLFRDEDLEVKVQGKRLLLKPMYISRKLGSVQKQIELDGGIEVKEIDSSTKVHFASKIVPALPDEAFAAFEEVFSIVESLLSESE